MVALTEPMRPRPLHPLHAILLAFPFPLFLGALLSDLAYGASYHVQWANFSAWLIAGGLLVGAFAMAWASTPKKARNAARVSLRPKPSVPSVR